MAADGVTNTPARVDGANESTLMADASGDIDVSVVLVSYNTRDLLLEAITSVIADDQRCTTEIIVVDNDSRDGSADAVSTMFPDVRLVKSPENVGFAAGVNLGLRNTHGRFVLLLNPDSRVKIGSIDALADYLDAHDNVGIVGPRVVDGAGRNQTSAWQFPSLVNLVLSGTYAYKLFPQSSVLNRERLAGAPLAGRVDAVSGCAFMLRREVLEAIGPLDSSFFMYLEETDFCLRARMAGFETHFVPAGEVVHLGGKSSEQQPRRNFLEYRRSQLKYFSKHRSRLDTQLARMLLLMFLVLRLPYWLLRGMFDTKARSRAADYGAGVAFLIQAPR